MYLSFGLADKDPAWLRLQNLVWDTPSGLSLYLPGDSMRGGDSGVKAGFGRKQVLPSRVYQFSVLSFCLHRQTETRDKPPVCRWSIISYSLPDTGGRARNTRWGRAHHPDSQINNKSKNSLSVENSSLKSLRSTKLIGKDSDAGRDWGQEEKGTTEDEMAGWHH